MNADQIAAEVAERVRTVVAEAEERAAQIVRDAEEEAQRIRDRAEEDGRGRLEDFRRALDDLQGKLGHANASAVSAEVPPGPVPVPEPQPPTTPDPGPAPVPEPTPEPPNEPEPPLIPEPTPPPDEGTPPTAAAGNGAGVPGAGGKSDDSAAARLVAMNMALDGASREAIEGHLSEFYALGDTGAIVDDVLALTTT